MKRNIHAGMLFAFLILVAIQGLSQFRTDKKIQLLLRHSASKADYQSLPKSLQLEPVNFTSSRAAPEKRYECIVYTTQPGEITKTGVVINSTYPTFSTVIATVEQIQELLKNPAILRIESPGIDKQHNDLSVAATGAGLLHTGQLNNTAYTGKGVIVAIYDSGIDWKHADFRNLLDNTKSRIIRIWDQTLTPTGAETSPAGFSYGVEYTQAQINDELDGTPANFVRETDTDGHGTHVAGTATGNGGSLPGKKYKGIAPDADIVIIKGGNGTFSETRIIDGINYLNTLANALNKPVVLNMSLGGHVGPHDGTRAYEKAIDQFNANPGRAVVLTAGNDNGDLLHNTTTLAANGSTIISFTVPSVAAKSDIFEYRFYLDDNSDVTATLTAPATVTGGGGSLLANAGEDKSAAISGDNFQVYLENGLDINSNDRYVDVDVRGLLSTSNPSGTWTLTIVNNTSNTPVLHGWLYDKGDAYSALALNGADNNFLTGSPGNATTGITVGSYTTRNRWHSEGAGTSYSTSSAIMDNISSFSSVGPRRDGVLKPEITTAGQAVISCLSSTEASVTSSDIVISGLYKKSQGTSMAAPAVAGAVALLFQAKPTATAAEIKNLITATANTDELTNAAGIPNTTWGYGRLNVFKAASSLFSCGQPAHKIYQFESNYSPGGDNGVSTSRRYAVKFTADVNGRFAGAYYAASTTVLDMRVELRASVSGVPGTLLGTKDFTAGNSGLLKSSWNYFDMSDLAIPVTTATDYFIVMYPVTAGGTWSVRRVATTGGTHSFNSSNSGSTWSSETAYNYCIRTAVFSNSGIAGGNIVSGNASDTRDVNTSNQFQSNCALISQVVPAGANPVSGDIKSRVWIESSVPAVVATGTPYVQRHYEITPLDANPATATGRITLYFTQAEFTAFNNHPGSTLNLPVDGDDALNNKANLRIGKFSGTSSDESGLAESYTGSNTVIDPADNDIVWNAAYNRWEVSFDNNNGFSGFIVQTINTSVLDVKFIYFVGQQRGMDNLLKWKIACDLGPVDFVIERSINGTAFSPAGTATSIASYCNEPFEFLDQQANGNMYYRIKAIEAGGKVTYSTVVFIRKDASGLTSVVPNLMRKGEQLQVNYFGNAQGSFVINDVSGRLVYSETVLEGTQKLNPGLQTSGLYIYTIRDRNGNLVTSGKIIVQ